LLLLLVQPGDRRRHRWFSPSWGIRQTTLRRARGGRGLLGHALIDLGDLPFTQCTRMTLLGRHLLQRLLLGHLLRHLLGHVRVRHVDRLIARCRLHRPGGLTHRLLRGCRGGGWLGCPSGQI
jgi:hypothetical protein